MIERVSVRMLVSWSRERVVRSGTMACRASTGARRCNTAPLVRPMARDDDREQVGNRRPGSHASNVGAPFGADQFDFRTNRFEPQTCGPVRG
jgi:hypothetical protein